MKKKAQDLSAGDVVIEWLVDRLMVYQVFEVKVDCPIKNVVTSYITDEEGSQLAYLYNAETELEVNVSSDDIRSTHGQFLSKFRPDAEWN